MAAALFIVLEREISGFDSFVNGKALSQALESLDPMAVPLEVSPLMSFFSMSSDEAEEMADATGLDPDEVALPEETWFEARSGLSTVLAYLERVRTDSGAFEDPEAVIADLKEFEAVLERAHAEGVRWHLGIDF